MTKNTLLAVSGIADTFDLAFGWIIGPWTIVVDLPVTIIHVWYAGPRALFTLAEYVPFVGVLPLYTLLAMSYDDHETATQATVVNQYSSDHSHAALPPPTLPASDKPFYLQVRGKQIGPLTSAQATQLYRSGTLPSDSLCWQEGMAGWEPIQVRLS
jgi:hypothetical protein